MQIRSKTGLVKSRKHERCPFLSITTIIRLDGSIERFLSEIDKYCENIFYQNTATKLS